MSRIHHLPEEALPREGRERAKATASKPRLLIVSDSPERLNNLKAAFIRAEIEIATATPEGLQLACHRQHNLAVVDVGPSQLSSVLEILRTDTGHSEIPVLVDVSRIITEPALAGVLPKYRAMPCSPAEQVALARRCLTSITGQWRAKRLL